MPVLYLVLAPVLGLVLGSSPDRVLEQALDRTVVLALAKAPGAGEEPAAAAVAAAATVAAVLKTPRSALHPESGQCPGSRLPRDPWPRTASGLVSLCP